jgi:hypothetical protein
MSLKTTVLTALAFAGRLALAWPRPPLHARILERQVDVEDEYDYIIIGGGTSGLTVGDRLTENGDCKLETLKTNMLILLTV